MSHSKQILLSSFYLPNIAWFQHAVNAEKVILENHENYIKQSYRNRCKILTANGIMDLSIPVVQGNHKQLISQITTLEEENWRKQHWKSISSAYGNSAFFLYYKDHFESYFSYNQNASLFNFNFGLIQLLLKLLKLDLKIVLSENFKPYATLPEDKRNYFLSKGIPNADELKFNKPYYQVFAEKFPFQPNLSIIDLLFNVGPLSKDYLLQI